MNKRMNFRKLIKNLMLQVGGLKFSNQVLLLIDIRCQSSLTQERKHQFQSESEEAFVERKKEAE